MPRLNAWGRSISINDFKVQASQGTGQEARIEMQSGDVVVIKAAPFALARP
jgi:translation initiation factor IF-1